MPRAAVTPDVRETVLAAAAHLMDTCGFRKMTMEAIAAEARIGKATIYGYFDSKEDVALSVIRRHQECIKARWIKLAGEDAPPDVRLRRMVVDLVLSGFDKAQQCRQSMDETLAALRHAILKRRYEFNGELAGLLAAVLRQGCDSAVFRCDDPDASAQAIITCVSGLNPTNLAPQELGERGEIEVRTHQIVDLLLCGLRVRHDS